MKNIFYAEDNPADAELFSIALSESGESHSLHTFEDGVALLNYLNKKEIIPDIIFLDINMPRLSGYECLMKIRSSQAFKHLPIIIFTTSDSMTDLNRAYALGANLYIQKPNEFEKWKDVIQDSISKFTTAIHQDSH